MKRLKSFFIRSSQSAQYTLSDPFQAPNRLRIVGCSMAMSVWDYNDGAVSIMQLVTSNIVTGSVLLTGANVIASLPVVTDVQSAAGFEHNCISMFFPLGHEMIGGERVWIYGGCSGALALMHAVIQYIDV